MAEEEEEDNGFALDPEQLNVFYEVLFKRIMDIMDNPNINVNPFEDMVKILSRLSHDNYYSRINCLCNKVRNDGGKILR
ncbi:MAG: hypothetical protein ACTSSC_12065 [Promethearchaeota archaeon]